MKMILLLIPNKILMNKKGIVDILKSNRMVNFKK